jgi:hypothetical protein
MVAHALAAPGRSLVRMAEQMMPAMSQIIPGPNTAFYADQFGDYMQSLPVVA